MWIFLARFWNVCDLIICFLYCKVRIHSNFWNKKALNIYKWSKTIHKVNKPKIYLKCKFYQTRNWIKISSTFIFTLLSLLRFKINKKNDLTAFPNLSWFFPIKSFDKDLRLIMFCFLLELLFVSVKFWGFIKWCVFKLTHV